MKPSLESKSSNSEHNGGSSLQMAMVSTEGDGRSTVTSLQPRQNVSCHQESGSMDNNSPGTPSSNSHVIIDMESTAGDECSSALSAPHQQNVVSDHQGSGNPNNSPDIQPVSSGVSGGSAGGNGSSAQYTPPYCREVSAEDRKTYLQLYEAAKDGKWEAAKGILESGQRDNLLLADLTNRKETILHVATQANQAGFVRQLLNYLKDHEIERKAFLESEDVNKNTAFVFAVASGYKEIVDIMEEEGQYLLNKGSSHERVKPIHIAALQGKIEMARYLYQNTVSRGFEYDLELLFFLLVDVGIYDLALELLRENPRLAFETDYKGETLLQILSRRPLGSKQTQQHKLVRYLWEDIFLEKSDREIINEIRRPPHVLFNAAKVGNFKFLELLISTYPYLVWEVDERNRSIIHIAVLHRQADIFNFIRCIGSAKDIIARYEVNCDEGNSSPNREFVDGNLLHLGAMLPTKDEPNLVFGVTFQMTLELLWFEAVKKMVPPSFMEMKNSKGLTPHQLFTENHKELVKEAQSWTKETTNCCMLVSTLITTGVFTATFSIPGGFKDNTGSPHYLEDDKKRFMIFSIFDAIAMISSSSSIFIFFSMLISRHAEDDFHHRSLTRKLILGLITLLISIISMMVSFSSAFIMYFNAKTVSHGSHDNVLKWVILIFICALSFIPVAVFINPLWKLMSHIRKLTKTLSYGFLENLLECFLMAVPIIICALPIAIYVYLLLPL